MFDSIVALIAYCESFIGNIYFLAIINTISFSLKLCLLIALVRKTVSSRPKKRPWIFLFFTLIGAIIHDFTWVIKLTSLSTSIVIDYRIVLFFVRNAWAFVAIQFHALALFMESLTEKNYILSWRHKALLPISGCFVLFFIFIQIFYCNCSGPLERPPIEFTMEQYVAFYASFILILPSLIITIRKIYTHKLPRILKKQLLMFTNSLVGPYWIGEVIQTLPFMKFHPHLVSHSYATSGICTLLFTGMLYFCTKRIMGLRFLNLSSHVRSPIKLNFLNDFRTVLGQFGRVTNIKELNHITHSFFKDTLEVPLNKAHLFIRNVDQNYTHDEYICLYDNHIEHQVEAFLAANKSKNETCLTDHEILIYDEIEFSNFYEQKESFVTLLQFLATLNADIFVPICEKNNLVAYIVVERDARHEQLYSESERDEMIIFAQFLGNIINLLKNSTFEALIKKEHDLANELYHKHQEINKYKESLRSFMKTNKHKEIGILFYKNNSFVVGNKAAQSIINYIIDQQPGHRLTRLLRQMVKQVESYKEAQTRFTQDDNNRTIVVSAVPHLEKNIIIITLSYPDASDVIKEQIDALSDPTEWDYLLYLQTTESGKLVNQLIPGMSETMLNFKIELLKCAMSKKAILLNVADDDLMPMVELLHHISLRNTLHVIELQPSTSMFDIALQLFGINPVFSSTTYEKPLLEKLNNVGTLVIKNVHFLNKEIQEYLTEFIQYGYYRIFKSDHKISSDVRIICSSNADLSRLVQEGSFSPNFYGELKDWYLSMPSLLTISEKDLHALADGFSQQALSQNELGSILYLNNRNKDYITQKRPASLHDLKKVVHRILVEQSKKCNIYQPELINTTPASVDKDLVEIAKLGKKALKDMRVMNVLWNRFNKNQSKIADFLQVNRSSVNRRCKEYNLS